jgi:hypothetical protein
VLTRENLALDRFALLELLQSRSVSTTDGQIWVATGQYIVPEVEYGSLYRAALLSRREGSSPVEGRLRALSLVVCKPVGLDWLPVLSPAFLSKILPTPIVIVQPPPECLGLRVRLRLALPDLPESEAALIASMTYFPGALIACLRDLSELAVELLADAGVDVADLMHDCPHRAG